MVSPGRGSGKAKAARGDGESCPCGGKRRFDAGVTGADDGDIVAAGGVGFHHGGVPSLL